MLKYKTLDSPGLDHLFFNVSTFFHPKLILFSLFPQRPLKGRHLRKRVEQPRRMAVAGKKQCDSNLRSGRAECTATPVKEQYKQHVNYSFNVQFV